MQCTAHFQHHPVADVVVGEGVHLDVVILHCMGGVVNIRQRINFQYHIFANIDAGTEMGDINIRQCSRTIDTTTSTGFDTVFKTVKPGITNLIDAVTGTEVDLIGIETDVLAKIHRGIQIHFHIGAGTGTTKNRDVYRISTGKE